jgi:hypothetical protein
MSARATVNSSPLEIAQQHVITELILERAEAREKYNELRAKIAQFEGKTAKPKPLWYNQREFPIESEEETK